MERIGIFGGSFNPVHKEHYKIAKGAIEELSLDKLYVVPTFLSPHKKSAVMASGEDRFNMLKICFSDLPKTEVCNYELKAQGVSYTYLTILHFKKLHPNAKLYLIMGSDMLENFPTWKNPEIITENATLALLERRGDGINTQKIVDIVKNRFNANVEVLKEFGTTYSATEIRVNCALGLSVSEFLDGGVADYIKLHNLYQGDEYYNYVKRALPEKRLIHTAGVIITALKYAKVLGVDSKKAELSALLHDVAKYVDINSVPKGVVPSDCPIEVAHQYVGEYIANKVLGVKDEEVLNAIKFHTTGRPNMTALEKIIYISDLLEPSRKYIGVDELRRAVLKDFNEGFIVCINEVLQFLQKQGGEIYPLTIETTKYYNESV